VTVAHAPSLWRARRVFNDFEARKVAIAPFPADSETTADKGTELIERRSRLWTFLKLPGKIIKFQMGAA
jgi:hypothetical protein